MPRKSFPFQEFADPAVRQVQPFSAQEHRKDIWTEVRLLPESPNVGDDLGGVLSWMVVRTTRGGHQSMRAGAAERPCPAFQGAIRKRRHVCHLFQGTFFFEIRTQPPQPLFCGIVRKGLCHTGNGMTRGDRCMWRIPGLIDEVILDVEPVALGDGIPLFGGKNFQRRLELIESTRLSPHEVQLHYRVVK